MRRTVACLMLTLAVRASGCRPSTKRMSLAVGVVEAITGQLYLAVLLARLVALYTTRPRSR